MKTLSLRLLCRSRTEPSHRGLFSSNYQSQTGVVLVVSLIILLLLTIIGLSAMQTTALEERMAGNLRDKDLAFQVAESALRAAELSVQTIPLSSYTPLCTGGLCSETTTLPISLADSAILTDSFWVTNYAANRVLRWTVTNLGNSGDTYYFIQRICPLPCTPPRHFKITVRATGGRINTVVILQSIIYI
jgi:type IV pilus assembly protein PilX